MERVSVSSNSKRKRRNQERKKARERTNERREIEERLPPKIKILSTGTAEERTELISTPLLPVKNSNLF